MSIDHIVVRYSDRQGHWHKGLWSADEIFMKVLGVVPARLEVHINLGEIAPGDIAVSDVGLVVCGRAAPAGTGTFGLTGMQTFWVFLPGNCKTSAISSSEEILVRVTTGGS